jgi:hypothetical protein
MTAIAGSWLSRRVRVAPCCDILPLAETVHTMTCVVWFGLLLLTVTTRAESNPAIFTP